MNIAVCDDEKIIVDDIAAKLTSQCGDCRIIKFFSGEQLLESTFDFDMIFLDIEMSGINGMNTANVLRKMGYNGVIIFLTSHLEYMQEAFKVGAFRYLEKPIDNEKFNEAFSNARYDILNTEHIIFNEMGQNLCIKLTDIVYLEAYGDGTYIFVKDESVYDSARPLRYWQEQVGSEHFYRIHKSFIVSFLYVSSISNDGKAVLRCGREPLDISRRNLVPFKAAFFNYIKKYARIMA